MITNFKFRIFFIKIFIVFSIRIIYNVNWFYFNSSMLIIVKLFINNMIQHIKINIFWNSCRMLKNFFSVLSLINKSFSNNRFSFIVCWIHFNVIYFQKIFKRIIIKFTTLINPYFICYFSFEIIFWNALTIVVPFLSFIGITHAYLLKKWTAHNKYLFALLYLLSDCISAKSIPQILSLKDE